MVFAFDLGSPETYFAAERVARLLPGARWRPVVADALHGGAARHRVTDEALAARAAELRLPFVWPEATSAAPRAAMRVASLAAEAGRAAEFVVAAARLAFAGGFDLDEPETLAEAAAAAGLPLGACLRAAGDVRRDGPMERDALALLRRGADRLPVLSVGRELFCGEDRVAEAARAAARAA